MLRLNAYHRSDGRWEGRISQGKRDDGKRKFRYILAGKKKEALRKMEEIHLISRPSGICSKTLLITFSEWFSSARHRVNESTAANYTMKADNNILLAFGKKSTSSISQDDVYPFIAEKQKSGFSERYMTGKANLHAERFRFWTV